MRRTVLLSALLLLLGTSSFALGRPPASQARRGSVPAAARSSTTPTLWGRLLALLTSRDISPKTTSPQPTTSVGPSAFSDSQGGFDPDGKP